MKLFLCSHFSSVGSLIKEEFDNKKVAFIPTASLREGYTGYVGSARKLFNKLGAAVTEIDISTEAWSNPNHKRKSHCRQHSPFNHSFPNFNQVEMVVSSSWLSLFFMFTRSLLRRYHSRSSFSSVLPRAFLSLMRTT